MHPNDAHHIFDSRKEYLLEGTTMNAARYIEILTRFMKLLRRVHITRIMGFCSRPCSSSRSQYYQRVPDQKKKGVNIELPPYLPDLNTPKFFLFSRLKLSFKGKIFDDIPDIQRK
ncbi:hypothetical protein TNCV_3148751 [Trichonephila clavipes]|nr:hypothetical protein TNCV_3148751 [Trichonephila clavipes]